MELEIIAHRGFSAIAPENTLAAFAAAVQHQADSIEFDVQLSAEGVPVIIHDATLGRTTNGTGKVREQTLEQLKTLDAGSWFNTQFSGEPIPTLQETLHALNGKTQSDGLNQFVYLDVKQHTPWLSSEVKEFVQTIMNTGWEDRCIVACFDESLLEQVRQQSQRVILGYFVVKSDSYQNQLAKATTDGNAMILSLYHVLLENPSFVESSRSKGIDIAAWTVDSQEDFQKLIDIDVVRIITNSLVGNRNPFKVTVQGVRRRRTPPRGV